MGQRDILEYLKRVKPKYKYVKDIMKAVNISYGAANNNLGKLYSKKLVIKKFVYDKDKPFFTKVIYKYKG